MIVYFWTKSKAGQGICLGLAVLGLAYGQFVFLRTIPGHQFSVQIVRNQAPSAPVVLIGQEGAQVPEHAFVASKRGKYYYPSLCSKAKTLSIKNMLYFKDISAAEAAGFKASSGC